ncbi:cholecystokinin receptor-like [Salvelinus namaycush]|uniref:Gastrin/cholecystokinin type B receptor n=1 Tax=Salvelinus namaycush TaxID=8040 RepID=A0A8U0U1A4_SALNM|nr:cholecystokinin receptor-like [Salvelinus namaycush]
MALQTSNDTSLSTFLDCLQSKSSVNASGNMSKEVTNTTCDNASVITKTPSTRQKEMDSVRILLYSLIFLLSVFGNLLIIVVLTVNKRMRTVTNSFLLSLAVSDLTLAVFCMPFTLIPNMLEDFIFGAAMCKMVTYFMALSVSISTFSLVAIATERYSAICNPLKSRAWQTRSHAYRVIAAIWVLSLVMMVPYPVFSHLKSFPKPDRTTGHMCRLEWPSGGVEQTWYMLLLLILFFIPGVVMIVAYGLISRELCRGMKFELDQNRESSALKNGVKTTVTTSNNDTDDDGCYIQMPKKPPSMELSTLTTPTPASPKPRVSAEHPRSNTSEAKLLAKKRVIRMLIVTAVLFFLCWMPLYTANTWKAFHISSAHRLLSGAPISFIHLLSYTSACVNPVIYCFMNTRFRKALLTTFAHCRPPCCRGRRGMRNGRDDEMTVTGTIGPSSMSKISYTTVSTAGAY